VARRALFWPTAWAGLGFAILIGLGLWQVQRLGWKEGLIAQRQGALGAAPVAVPETLATAAALEFHPVRASGVFQNDRELYLNAQSLRGGAGFDVVTPLRLTDGTVLMVNRGFVPTDKKAPETRAPGEISGPTSVVGLLRLAPAGKPSLFIPENDAARNSWFYVDLGAMAKADAIVHVLPFYLDADASPNPGGWPQGGQTEIDLPNHHLQYAVTWFALAAALVVIYVRFARRRLRERG